MLHLSEFSFCNDNKISINRQNSTLFHPPPKHIAAAGTNTNCGYTNLSPCATNFSSQQCLAFGGHTSSHSTNHHSKKCYRGFAACTFGTGIADGDLPGLHLVQEMFAGFCRAYFWYRKCSRNFTGRTFATRNARGILPDVLLLQEILAGICCVYFWYKKCSRGFAGRISETGSGVWSFLEVFTFLLFNQKMY